MHSHKDGEYTQVSLTDLETIAKTLLSFMENRRVCLFYGDLGSGKTTFIKTVGALLGVKEVMNSPTFSIINEYLAENGSKIFHFDFYRIQRETEAYDIGVEEYFCSGHYCFIEWPEKITTLIPPQHVAVRISYEDNQHRTIAISIHDGEETNRI